MSKGDLLTIIGALQAHALTHPVEGGPQSDEEYAAISRVTKKVSGELEKMGVRCMPKRFTLAEGELTLWVPEKGASVDVRAR